jgi:hypothetical protein
MLADENPDIRFQFFSGPAIQMHLHFSPFTLFTITVRSFRAAICDAAKTISRRMNAPFKIKPAWTKGSNRYSHALVQSWTKQKPRSRALSTLSLIVNLSGPTGPPTVL